MISLDTPLQEIDRPANADQVAQCIAAIALSCVGLTGAPQTRDRFATLLGPVDAPESDRAATAHSRDAIRGVLTKRFGAGGISTCGMVGEGIHARLGAGASTLYRPYVWGTSVSRAVSYLQAMHAWTDAHEQADLEPRPQLGAYVVIGCRGPGEQYGGIEHVRTVVAWEDDVCVTVDGGSVDAATGLQAIHLVRTRWMLRDGRPWMVMPTLPTSGRRVYGWGDPGLMTWRDDMRRVLVPEGWESVDV